MPGETALSRRDALRMALAAAVSAALPRALAQSDADLPRIGGDARVDVRRYGASGNGMRDETAAFQRAVDALPAEGGTVVVPSGKYLIDATRSVRLRGAMRLEMATDAQLLAIPNAQARAYVLSAAGIDDLEIVGGRIVGERMRHRGRDGEWGHGLSIRGCRRVRVRDLRISHCWGDGISIGAQSLGGRPVVSRDVLLQNVFCRLNRRQGLTIGRAHRVRVVDCAFLDTGGTAPGCGIDIEPDPGERARDILIRDCVLKGNRGGGIHLYKRVSRVRIHRCQIIDNGGYGVLAMHAEDCELVGNTVRGNALRGVMIHKSAHDIRLAGNTFADNGPARRAKAHWKDLDIAPGAARIQVARDNRFD